MHYPVVNIDHQHQWQIESVCGFAGVACLPVFRTDKIHKNTKETHIFLCVFYFFVSVSSLWITPDRCTWQPSQFTHITPLIHLC